MEVVHNGFFDFLCCCCAGIRCGTIWVCSDYRQPAKREDSRNKNDSNHHCHMGCDYGYRLVSPKLVCPRSESCLLCSNGICFYTNFTCRKNSITIVLIINKSKQKTPHRQQPAGRKESVCPEAVQTQHLYFTTPGQPLQAGGVILWGKN